MPKGEIINTNAYDLLGNGMWYWLGGSSYDENFLWFLSGHGMVSYSNDYETYGIRTCISLNSGITVNTSDTSKDGSTPEKAYILN